MTSTGTWIQGAPGGNISNPNGSGNAFRNLTIAGRGVTTTLTGNVYVGSYNNATNIGLTIGSATPNTLYGGGTHYIELQTYSASNVLTINNLTMGSALNSFIFQSYTTTTINAFTLPNGFATYVDFEMETAASNIVAGGNWNFGNNDVYIGSSKTTTTQPTYYVDMATFSLTTTGNLYIGTTGPSYNGYLKLGISANHSVGNITVGGTGTGSILDMGSSIITASGNVNFTNLATLTYGTGTLVMAGASKTLTSALRVYAILLCKLAQPLPML